jgi:HEPN domain-containing protein
LDAQQAAEKAIKAVLLRRAIRFPQVHDLAALLTLVEAGGVPIPPPVWEAQRLTRYAVVTRYPGVLEPVTEGEYTEAVTTADAVIRWAERSVE